MHIAISLENLQSDLEVACASDELVVHDIDETEKPSTETWLRANSLAQLAINPLRFISQQQPTPVLAMGGDVLLPSKVREFPPDMVHFGSEVTVNAAIGMIDFNEPTGSLDINIHHRVDEKRIKDPALAELLGAYHQEDVPVIVLDLDEAYDGEYRWEYSQSEWFEHILYQFYPDHREILLPNRTEILNETAKERLRDYFKIAIKDWKELQEADPDSVQYGYTT